MSLALVRNLMLQILGMESYDVCIVGAGMIGSAAARHASLNSGIRVCLIGPAEPLKREIKSGREVFGTYYDEGRITRSTAFRPVWALLAQRSIKRYRELEQKSGMNIYQEVGELTIGTKDGKHMQKLTENAKESGILHRLNNMDYALLRAQYPSMIYSAMDVALHNSTNSGYINPRQMVAAQIKVAQKQGCMVKRDVVLDITKSEDNWYILKTESGTNLRSRKILLATNVFTSMHSLLGNCYLDFTPMPQTVTLAEISAQDAYKLRSIPVVLYNGLGSSAWPTSYPRNPDGNISFYMLPPIQYPDGLYLFLPGQSNVWRANVISTGKYYIKLGHSDYVVTPLEQDQIQEWYCGRGNEDLELQMFNLLKGIFPDVNFLSHHGDACVTMVTPTYHPYIDLLSPTFGVAVGGNGLAAKSSDEIGRVAAEMIMHCKWTYDIPWENFKVRIQKGSRTTSKL